ncbi:pentapeptide repeat-containing protein, partial [Nostoc sp.]
LVGQDKALEFQKFIKADSCPERVKELAREPLLLYLLGAMHRDKELNIEMFDGANDAQAKIITYQKTLDWVLTKQRSKKFNQELTEFDTEDLRLILTEAGLCVTQSGKEWTSIKAIESRLRNDKTAREMLESAQRNINESPLRNALAAFYIKLAKASSTTSGAVEFIHRSFGEFLCAQKIKQSLRHWTKIDSESRRERYVIDDDKLAEEIYDLFGYGGLTQEIVEYLMALLDSEEQFQYLKLFERLEDFYHIWCQGKFISRFPKNLPLNQMQKFQTEKILLDLREVDIFTGLNVMILLLELHRYTQTPDELKDNIVFYPCGKKDSDNFDQQRLLRIIGYSNSVAVSTFSETVGYFLSRANLRGANLRGANLEGANLEDANLEGTNLEGTNLEGANLEDANLEGANLEGANLEDANLEGAILEDAILSGANLSGANLEGANLEGAILSGANLSGADLSGANLSGTNLSGANLDGAKLRGANLDGAKLLRANLSGTNLSGANLSGANLSGANLSGANLKCANLSGANLSGAKLSGTNLSGAKLLRAKLKGADLSPVKLKGADLIRADLSDANLKGADLIRADLSDSNLKGADLIRADLSDANLNGVDLKGANLSDANLNGANLSDANLNGAKLNGAKLNGANLNGAKLNGANLNGANLNGANLVNISWDENTTWDNVEGLDTARNVPKKLLSQRNPTAHPSLPQDIPPSA